jgi:hypothetical protein
LTNVYKKWNPQDKFLQENYQNIEEGKNRVFNVKDEVDLQKNHSNVYTVLKKNDMVKKPDIPKFYKGVALTEAEKKAYSNTYWTEYIRQLDNRSALEQSTIDELKARVVGRERADTPTGIRETSKLQSIANEAAARARNIADKELRNTK